MKDRRQQKKGTFWKVLLIVLLVTAVGAGGVFLVRHFRERSLMAARYDAAQAMLQQGHVNEAAELFAAAEGHKEAQEMAGKIFYEQAEALLAEGKITYAAMAFGKAGDYLDARERSFALWEQFADRDTLTDLYHRYELAAVRPDGTIIRAENTKFDWESYHPLLQRVFNTDAEAADTWTDIIAIDGWFALAGLKSDGTVVTDHKDLDVSDWTDIVDVCMGSSYLLGLRSDGTVVAEMIYDSYGACKVEEWTDIIAICTDQYHTLGLRADGTVVAAGCEIPANEAENAEYIEAGQCDVSGWRDIVAIRAYDDICSCGIKADGTFVLAGNEEYYREDMKDFAPVKDIETVCWTPVGLRFDGTVVYTSLDGEFEVEGWSDIVALSGGFRHLAGVRSDGSVVVCIIGGFYEDPEWNERGQEVANQWIIKVPAIPDYDVIKSGFGN